MTATENKNRKKHCKLNTPVENFSLLLLNKIYIIYLQQLHSNSWKYTRKIGEVDGTLNENTLTDFLLISDNRTNTKRCTSCLFSSLQICKFGLRRLFKVVLKCRHVVLFVPTFKLIQIDRYRQPMQLKSWFRSLK